MKLHVLSDIHAEIHEFQPNKITADIIIMAGDIHSKGRATAWARELFTWFDGVIIVCAGNHDLYGGHFQKTIEQLRDSSCDKIKFLEMGSLLIGDYRFLVATGWTDYTATGNAPLAEWDALRQMNDFRKIRAEDSYRNLTTDDVRRRSCETRDWLMQEIAAPFHGTTVVVTHHAPSVVSLGGRVPSHLDAAYANRWEFLMGEKVALWVHGHTHRATDYTVNGTRVIANPRGYPGENTGFDPNLVVMV